MRGRGVPWQHRWRGVREWQGCAARAGGGRHAPARRRTLNGGRRSGFATRGVDRTVRGCGLGVVIATVRSGSGHVPQWRAAGRGDGRGRQGPRNMASTVEFQDFSAHCLEDRLDGCRRPTHRDLCRVTARDLSFRPRLSTQTTDPSEALACSESRRWQFRPAGACSPVSTPTDALFAGVNVGRCGPPPRQWSRNVRQSTAVRVRYSQRLRNPPRRSR
jgi:hypothetical protein